MKKRISVLNLAIALSLLILAQPSANAQEMTRKEHRRIGQKICQNPSVSSW